MSTISKLLTETYWPVKQNLNYAVCLRIFKQNNLVWPLAFLHQYRLQASNRLKAAAFGISIVRSTRGFARQPS